jgi:hypothetical protein
MRYTRGMDTTSTIPPVADEPAKRYIRTFASDMQTLKEGGTPDLAPLPSPEVPAQIAAPAEPVPQPMLAVPIVPAPVEVAPPVPAAPMPPLAAESPKVEPSTSNPTPIETYAGDFRERMTTTDASTFSVLAREQDAGQQFVPAPLEENAPKKGATYVIAGIALVVVGGAGAYLAYAQYVQTTLPVVLAPTNALPIAVDASADISGTGTTLLQAVEQAVADPLAQGAVRALSLTGGTPGADIFSALPLSAPGGLVRNIAPIGSLAGVVNVGGGNSAFFILRVDTYPATFSAMLSWEPTVLGSVAPLFPQPAALAAASSTVASTTAPVASTTATGFRDETVSNHDVRVYRDATGASALTYGYWDPTTLIITRDPAGFAEILSRLANARGR